MPKYQAENVTTLAAERGGREMAISETWVPHWRPTLLVPRSLEYQWTTRSISRYQSRFMRAAFHKCRSQVAKGPHCRIL